MINVRHTRYTIGDCGQSMFDTRAIPVVTVGNQRVMAILPSVTSVWYTNGDYSQLTSDTDAILMVTIIY